MNSKHRGLRALSLFAAIQLSAADVTLPELVLAEDTPIRCLPDTAPSAGWSRVQRTTLPSRPSPRTVAAARPPSKAPSPSSNTLLATPAANDRTDIILTQPPFTRGRLETSTSLVRWPHLRAFEVCENGQLSVEGVAANDPSHRFFRIVPE